MKRAAVLIALALAYGTAAAGNPSAAKPHIEAGVAAYQRGDYDTASREFEAAYGLDPDPKSLYAWAQSRRLGGRCGEALPLYELYIARDPGENNVAAARAGIDLCKRAQASDKPPIDKPPIDKPPIDKPPTDKPPTDKPPTDKPPTDKPPTDKPPTDKPPGDRTPADRRPEEPPPPSETSAAWYRDRLGVGLAIGGVVATGTGIGFLVMASRSEDRAASATARQAFVDLLDEATFRRRVGVTCLAVGGALVIGSIVRFVTNREAPASLAISGRSVLLIGRF